MGKLTQAPSRERSPARQTRLALTCLLFVVATIGWAADDRAAENDVWYRVRSSLFGSRPILEQADEVIRLTAPLRAEDAATVPLGIQAQAPAPGDAFVEKIYLVIDKNPSPLGAVFTFTRDSGRADIETRVRIDDYTMVRAVAELSDGRLYMARSFVKAAGGCSAPAAKDRDAAAAQLGRMRLRVDAPLALERPNLAQLMISHPNSSGLAMDQMTRLYVPARFVRHIDVRYLGRPVMSAEVDFSISENPNFRFYFVPHGNGALTAEVVDSSDSRFETSLSLRAADPGR
jgi:sulfur-oxidizing protein SoxY